MAIASHLAALHDATFAEFGEGATWAGLPVRVRRYRPDEVNEFGRRGVVQVSKILKVRASEVASPQKGDVVVFADEIYAIIGEPMANARRTVWTCEAKLA